MAQTQRRERHSDLDLDLDLDFETAKMSSPSVVFQDLL